MALGRAVGVVAALCLAVPATGVAGQDSDRIWGRVDLRDGGQVEGFIRWDRNEGSWVDLLNGTRRASGAFQDLWLEAVEGEPVDRVRTIELMGFRISWDEDDPEFGWAESGIRFGHLEEIIPLDRDAVLLRLRNGEEVELQGGSTDIGGAIREFLVEAPGRDPVELSWHQLARITFGPVPSSAVASAPRLYGTVEDRWGTAYTGYISWDLDEILASDILDGESGGRDREIEFGRIAAIERDFDGSRVTLTNGEELVMTGSNDVGRGHRGVQISDPGLGMVEVEWDEFESVRFHEAPSAVGYDAFDGGYRLEATVVTRGGDRLTGALIWDADESWSWEILDGSFRDVVYDVEFSRIDRIQRASSRGARVILRDGRTLEMEDSNDVSDEIKGIFVAPDGWQPGVEPEEMEWIVITWDELDEVILHHE